MSAKVGSTCFSEGLALGLMSLEDVWQVNLKLKEEPRSFFLGAVLLVLRRFQTPCAGDLLSQARCGRILQRGLVVLLL